MYSDNIEYARGRLIGTIVMYQGEPVHIEDIKEDGTTVFKLLKTMDINICFVDDLDLVGQNRLGYVNYEGTSYHVVRKPLRHDWRQGIRAANIVFSGPEGFYELPYAELRHTILGIYPTFQEAAERVSGGMARKCAFSRNFALGEGNQLFYKEKWVGSYDKLVMLQEKFKYLTESLNDIMEGNYAYD
jgi:hypothetical protein